MSFGAGGGALLPMVAVLLVRPSRPGLEKGHALKKKKNLCSKQDFPRLFNTTHCGLIIVAKSTSLISLMWCVQ